VGTSCVDWISSKHAKVSSESSKHGGDVNDEILLRAAERLLGIIGEAATSCSPEFRAMYPAIDWVGIARLRVVLAHHYHRTQPELIWRFTLVDTPILHTRLRE
jgi:uncharacterized protein with HEPN domain